MNEIIGGGGPEAPERVEEVALGPPELVLEEVEAAEEGKRGKGGKEIKERQIN